MMFRRVKQWIVIIGILPFTGCVSFETDILARKAPSVPPSAQPGDQFSERSEELV